MPPKKGKTISRMKQAGRASVLAQPGMLGNMLNRRVNKALKGANKQIKARSKK